MRMVRSVVQFRSYLAQQPRPPFFGEQRERGAGQINNVDLTDVQARGPRRIYVFPDRILLIGLNAR